MNVEQHKENRGQEKRFVRQRGWSGRPHHLAGEEQTGRQHRTLRPQLQDDHMFMAKQVTTAL
jgi:hypothetical protein